MSFLYFSRTDKRRDPSKYVSEDQEHVGTAEYAGETAVVPITGVLMAESKIGCFWHYFSNSTIEFSMGLFPSMQLLTTKVEAMHISYQWM